MYSDSVVSHSIYNPVIASSNPHAPSHTRVCMHTCAHERTHSLTHSHAHTISLMNVLHHKPWKYHIMAVSVKRRHPFNMHAKKNPKNCPCPLVRTRTNWVSPLLYAYFSLWSRTHSLNITTNHLFFHLFLLTKCASHQMTWINSGGEQNILPFLLKVSSPSVFYSWSECCGE